MKLISLFLKGDGAFAKKNIDANTIIAQYGGYRMDKSQYLPIEISTDEQYRHNIGLGNGVLDIPSGYESIDKYNGTMAHKFNHRFFKENCYAHYVRISAFFYKLVLLITTWVHELN